MLALTRKAEYALIAACHLARCRRRTVSARDIAGESRIRLPLLMNVLKVLNQRGVLRSVRGSRGGYSLAVPPEELTLARLVEAVEGPARLVPCGPPYEADHERCCDLLGSCAVRMPLLKVHQQLRQFLEGVTVADVAFDEAYDSREPLAALRVLAQ
jgi:Rrf2 family protein